MAQVVAGAAKRVRDYMTAGSQVGRTFEAKSQDMKSAHDKSLKSNISGSAAYHRFHFPEMS